MSRGPLVWVDCEMTGLDPDNDRIIEICCLLTDGNLNLIDEEGYESVVHCPKDIMDNMNEWCIEHHGKSGLTAKVLQATTSIEQVDNELLEYVKKHIGESGKGILAGNSIHQDRMFLRRELPKFLDYLHYRQVDVSSIKEVGLRHNPVLMEGLPAKRYGHTARSDIEDSIEELKWYYQNYLVKPVPGAESK